MFDPRKQRKLAGIASLVLMGGILGAYGVRADPGAPVFGDGTGIEAVGVEVVIEATPEVFASPTPIFDDDLPVITPIPIEQMPETGTGTTARRGGA